MQLGLERQRQVCRDLAHKRGWQIVREYEDAGLSAYNRRVVRPGFEAMLADLEAGVIDGIVCYDSDRLARQPRDLERLIDLYETTALIFATANKDIDLSTPDGRFFARLMVNVANKSSADTGRRVEAKHLQLAQRGIPVGGTRPFGWQADKRTINPEEAALVRQAARDVLAGVGLHTIVRKWNRAHITTTKGNPWVHQTLRQMLLSPRLAGFRVYRGMLLRTAEGEPVKGQYEAILDAATWEHVVAVLTARKGTHLGGRKYLLAGTARCSECSGPLYGNRGHGSFYYGCEPPCGKVGISGPKLDGLIDGLVRQYLANEDLDEPDAPEPVDRGELEAIGRRKAELMMAYTEGRLSAETVFPAVQQLEAQARQYRQVQAARIRQQRVKLHKADIAYDELDTAGKRAVIAALIRYVVVKPGSKRGGQFDETRVSVEWQE
jgi:site-specific DNA recombinase